MPLTSYKLELWTNLDKQGTKYDRFYTHIFIYINRIDTSACEEVKRRGRKDEETKT